MNYREVCTLIKKAKELNETYPVARWTEAVNHTENFTPDYPEATTQVEQKPVSWRKNLRTALDAVKKQIPSKYREDPSSILDQDADTILKQIESSDFVRNVKQEKERQDKQRLELLKDLFRKAWGK